MTDEGSSLISSLTGSSIALRDRWIDYELSSDHIAGAPYLAVGQIAVFAVDMMEAGEFDNVGALFREVERLLGSPSKAERKLLIVGLTEDVQNGSLNRGIDLSSWQPFLGPRSQAAWSLVQSLWAGSITTERFNYEVDDA